MTDHDRDNLLGVLAACGLDDPTHQTVHLLLQHLLEQDGGDDELLTQALQAACWRTRPQVQPD